MSSPTRLWADADVRAMFSLTMLCFIGFFLPLAALPGYAVREGTARPVAGSVTAVMLAATVITQIIVGHLSRRAGYLVTLLAGLVLLGAPAPLYLLDSSLWWLLVCSLLRGIGFGVVTVFASLLASRVAPPGRLGAVIGIYGLAIAVPNLLGTSLGAALTAAGHFPVVALLAGMPLLGMVILRRSVGILDGPHADPHPSREDRRLTIMRCAAPALVLLAATVANSGLIANLPIELPHGQNAALALLALTAFTSLARVTVGAIADRIGLAALFPITVMVLVTGTIIFGVALHHAGSQHTASAHGNVWLYVAACVFGLGYGALNNLTLLVSFARSPQIAASTASAVWNGAFDAGGAIGSYAVVALSATGLGFSATLLCCAGLIALTVPLGRP